MIRNLLFIVVLLCSLSAWSAEYWHTSKVKAVYPLPDGRFVINFYDDHSGCTNQNAPKYYYVASGQNGVTAEAAKNMLSVALTAGATGKTLAVAFNSATESCYVNRLFVDFSR